MLKNIERVIICLFLILLAYAVCGCLDEDKPQSTEEFSWAHGHWYERPLKWAGVAEDDYQICMRWAFGDDYFTCRGNELSNRWRARHPDLFVMYDSDDRWEAICRAGKAYLHEKKEPEIPITIDPNSEIVRNLNLLCDPNLYKPYQEPNQPAMKYSLPVPTWPDYIELPATLVIGHRTYIDFGGNKCTWEGIVLTKGTKIFFKEDE